MLKAIFAEQISCSGDIHDFIIATFTTQEKAEIHSCQFINKQDWKLIRDKVHRVKKR